MIRILTVLCMLLAASPADAGGCAQSDRRLDGRLMARMNAGVDVEQLVVAMEADYPGMVVTALDQVPQRPVHLVGFVPPAGWDQDDYDAFELDLESAYLGLATWIETLYENETPEGGSGSTFVDGPATASLYKEQYAAAQTGLGVAHDFAGAAGVVVAILDTGIDVDHAEFAGRIAPGGYDYIDGDSDPNDDVSGVDLDGDGLFDEGAGHGTFVAGLVTLVAPDTLILPLRVLDHEGRGDMWALTRGIYHAIDQGVEVINISISSTYNSQAVEDAIEEARLLGIPTVAAAGNCNREKPREYPAMRSNIIGVAAVDDLELKGGFSNYNDRLFISAPGVMYFDGGQPDPDRSMIGPVPGGDYAHWEGTSFATPIVAGAVALIRSQHPQWPATETTVDLIEAALASTAVDIDDVNPAYEGLLGAGRIDIGAAVALGGPAPEHGDIDGDGIIGANDLLIVLDRWGQVHTAADLNGDGDVNVDDLLVIIINWS